MVYNAHIQKCYLNCLIMSDCSSPVYRRRPRVVQETPASASSNHSGRPAVIRKKKKNKNVIKRFSNNRCNRRQQRLRCPLLELQAKEQGNSEDDDNSSDDRDATDDSIVVSGSDHSDGSFSIYAIGMSSQAEKHGFTVPLHKVRDRERDRASIADMVLSRISKNKNKNIEFEAYLRRVGDGGDKEDQEQLKLSKSAVSFSFENQELSRLPPPYGSLPEQKAEPVCPVVVHEASSAELPSSSSKLKQTLPFLPDFMTHSSSFPVPDLTFSEATRAPAVRPTGRLMLRRSLPDIVPKCDNSTQTSPRWEHHMKTVRSAAAGTDHQVFSDSSMQTSPQTHLSSCDSSGQTSPRLNEPLTLRELRIEVRELLKGMGF